MDHEVLIFTLHFQIALIYWFVWNCAIHNFDRKIGYCGLWHFLFYGWVGHHLQCSSLTITQPLSSNLGYLTTHPCKNSKKKKERRPNKSRLKQLKLIMGTRLMFSFWARNIEKEHGTPVKMTEKEMGKVSAWKLFIYIRLWTFLEWTKSWNLEIANLRDER